MSRYIAGRLALFFPTLLLVSVLAFVLLRAIPGDAVLAQLEDSPRLTPEAIGAMRANMGLADPLPTQFWIWGSRLLRGDLGESFSRGLDIRSEFVRRLPNTLQLAAVAIFVSVTLGIPLGALSAVARGSLFDFVARLTAVLWLAVPSFWLATLVFVLPSVWFDWSPSLVVPGLSEAPFAHVIGIVLPGVIVGLHSAAVSLRMTRSQLLEVLKQDYIRTAYAKGLAGRTVLGRHALKNAMIPVVTVLGAQVGALLGGSVVMESIFGIPGLGQWTIQSIKLRDYPVIQTLILFFAFTTLVVNLVVDVSYGWLDPRIKLG